MKPNGEMNKGCTAQRLSELQIENIWRASSWDKVDNSHVPIISPAGGKGAPLPKTQAHPRQLLFDRKYK